MSSKCVWKLTWLISSVLWLSMCIEGSSSIMKQGNFVGPNGRFQILELIHTSGMSAGAMPTAPSLLQIGSEKVTLRVKPAIKAATSAEGDVPGFEGFSVRQNSGGRSFISKISGLFSRQRSSKIAPAQTDFVAGGDTAAVSIPSMTGSVPQPQFAADRDQKRHGLRKIAPAPTDLAREDPVDVPFSKRYLKLSRVESGGNFQTIRLGGGSYGQIWKAIDHFTHKLVALKDFGPSYSAFLKERQMHELFLKENKKQIAKCVPKDLTAAADRLQCTYWPDAGTTVSDHFVLVLELYDGDLTRDLNELMQEKAGRDITANDMIEIFADLTTGLQEMASTDKSENPANLPESYTRGRCGWAHFDIKRGNVFLRYDEAAGALRAYIGDLGLARLMLLTKVNTGPFPMGYSHNLREFQLVNPSVLGQAKTLEIGDLEDLSLVTMNYRPPEMICPRMKTHRRSRSFLLSSPLECNAAYASLANTMLTYEYNTFSPVYPLFSTDTFSLGLVFYETLFRFAKNEFLMSASVKSMANLYRHYSSTRRQPTSYALAFLSTFVPRAVADFFPALDANQLKTLGDTLAQLIIRMLMWVPAERPGYKSIAETLQLAKI